MPYRFLVTLALTVSVLTGCQPPLTPPSDDIESAVTPDDESPDNSEMFDDPGSPDDPGEPLPQDVLRVCDDDIKQAIDQTIGAQTQAFRDRDFEAAYSLASPSFQAGMPLEVFSALIQSNYPQLLTATNARSGSCEVNSTDTVATILVRFDTEPDPSYTLRYVVEFVDDRWRISGANQEFTPETVA